MWSSFIKISWRKIWSNKQASFTKLFSLAIGIVSLFYIGTYVHQEMNFDKFHSNYDNIAKINTSISSPTGELSLGLTAAPLAPYIKSQAPEVLDYVRISKENGSHAIRFEDKLYSESDDILYADASFFKVFNFELLQGNKETALEGPDKILLTEIMANKYFGTSDAIGKILEYDGVPFTVSGIIEEPPSNSHLQFQFLISMDTFMKGRLPGINQNWGWFPMNTYLVLSDPSKMSGIEEQLKAIPEYREPSPSNDQYVLSVEPLKGLHFSSEKLGELGSKGNLNSLYVLLGIGLMILLLAISNFVNLTTAEITVKEKEVSVKKTIGASRIDIFKQFFTDTVLLSSLATIISMGLIAITLPYFENFIGTSINSGLLINPLLLLLLPIVPMVLALLGGIYPAIKFSGISAINPSTNTESASGIFNTRTLLLVFQFSITSALIIGSLIIYSQLDFMQSKDLGMDTAQKVVLDYGPNSRIGNSFKSIKEQLLEIPGIERVAFSSHVPGQVPNGVATQILDINGRSTNGEINLNLVDEDFIENYGLQLIAGRDFRDSEVDHTTALIINEAAMKAFGYVNPEEILGASFEQWGGNGKVVGVVKDFNYLSLHQKVGLLSFKIWPEQFMKITMEIAPANLKGTLAALESKWSAMYPDIPFNHYFVDDNFKAQYDKDKKFSSLINLFTVVSICIGILGLMAYARFWCDRKRKEMSIRKVLGARVALLVWRLYRGFSLPVLIGFILAIPFAYFLGEKWLQGFAYQFNLQWYFFVLPLVAMLIFAWLAVGTQTLKLALSNPVDHLKEE